MVVSNHGARQMDSTLSAIETLPDIARAVDGKAEVYLDSGVRRGSDVVKALALGARAVFIGRPQFWGLALGGEAGVSRMLDVLRREFALCLGYCGFASIRDITPGVVALPKANAQFARDTYDEVEALASLLRDGIITQKEYRAKKKALSKLGRDLDRPRLQFGLPPPD